MNGQRKFKVNYGFDSLALYASTVYSHKQMQKEI